MRYWKAFITIVLLTWVSRTKADNLTVDPVSMKVGETKEVGIILLNPTNQYVAFQFDIDLPDGITIVDNDAGEPDITLNEERICGHTLTVIKKGSNQYGILAYSFPVATFEGIDGALVYMTLKAEEKISEEALPMLIKSQVFTAKSGDEYKWTDISSAITVETNPGDANGDGVIDQMDIKASVNYIMTGIAEGFYFQNADISGDKVVNVADIVEIVKIIK